jgi:putative nucleotidyltransferase with HDIG domain
MGFVLGREASVFSWPLSKPKPAAVAAAAPAEPVPADKGVITLRTSCPANAKAEGPSELALEADVAKLAENGEKVIGSPGFDLPTLPGVALRVMDLLQNPKATVKEVSSLIVHDPAIAAKFLRMANSAYYGGTVLIENVDTAITRLGFNTVRNSMMSIALHGTILKDRRLGETAQRIWAHSISTAMVAQEMSRRFSLDIEGVFIAGLLHDIGKVPALLFVQKALTRDQVVRPEFVATLVERHHVRAGEALVKHWKLPWQSALAISCHHEVRSLTAAIQAVQERGAAMSDSERSEGTFTVCTVTLADRALAAMGFAEEPGSLDIAGSKIVEEMNLAPEKVSAVLESIPGLLQKMPALA